MSQWAKALGKGADGSSLLWLLSPEVGSLGIVLVARRLPLQ